MRFASALQSIVSLSRVIIFERSSGTGQRQRRQALIADALSLSRVALANGRHSRTQAVRSITLPIMLALVVACIAQPAAAQETGTTGRPGATMPPGAEAQQTPGDSPPTTGPPRDTRGGQGPAGGSSAPSDGPGPGGGTSGGSGGTTGRSGPGGGSGLTFPK